MPGCSGGALLPQFLQSQLVEFLRLLQVAVKKSCCDQIASGSMQFTIVSQPPADPSALPQQVDTLRITSQGHCRADIGQGVGPRQS